MGTDSRADSKRKYSWWWDSHISPKNSKWLQENLTDMDAKVKQMIRLIEEDADSFARRAEMYYKKRPELMKLVEEFYRAYRALAERYDHATGVLHQAHRTMAEAFPNQVPFVLADESPAGSATDSDPHTPDMQPICTLVDPDELQKDALGISPSHSPAVKRNGGYTEESDTVVGRKGLKQLNDLFGSGEGLNYGKLSEGKARKGLNFHDAEEKERSMQNNGSHDIKARVPTESERVGKAELEILTLKNTLAKLEAEKEAGLLQYQQSLERLSNLESAVSRAKEDCMGLNERASSAEAEVQTLKEALAKLETEREDIVLQYQQCLDKISNLEKNISYAQKDAGELNERASKAEMEAQSLKEDVARLEAEKEAALVQYKLCLEKISELEDKLLHAEEAARQFSERADKAERDVEILKQALTKLTEEKEDAEIHYQQCLESILSLERKLASAQEEAQRLNCEIDDGVVKLKGAEEKCLLLERSNQTMHSELESLAQKMAAQSGELTEKQKELGRLWSCIQEERLRFVEAETAFQTLQHLHSKSQEELRSMAAELQNRAQILQDLESHNQILQNEVEQIKVENKGLGEVNLSSALTIQNLQDEISRLRESIEKLEAEVELRVDERNALQQEIYCLKEELNGLNKTQQAIMEQVEAVGFSPDCFGSSVKDLQDENIKLKETCESDRSEKVVLLEKVEAMEKLIEKNALLENSLSDLNVELEGVREKVKALDESCKCLLAEKSNVISEKAMLVSQLQIVTDNLEKLTEKNNFLENSLLDVNAELEGLRVKSMSLQDLCLLLENQKSDLASAKGSLTSQLDCTQKRLEGLEIDYTELKEKYFSLEKERESMLHEVEELRVYLDAEKQKHASLAQMSESQLAVMASQILSLQEEGQCRKEEYEEELDKTLNSQIEIFILQKCVQDQLLECQKHLEASKLSEKLASELEQQNLEKQVGMKSLFDQLKILRVGLCQLLKILELDADWWSEDNAGQDQTLLNHVADKLQEMQEFLFKMQDGHQQLVIENSVLVALLGQLHAEVANLVTAKNTLDQELRARSGQFLVLQSESQKLAEMNEELRLNILEGEHKEEVLNVELKNLQGQLLDLQGAYQNLKEDNCKVLDEQRSLMKSVSDLGEENCNLEEEKCAIFAEAISQSTLSLMLQDIICEKSVEMKELRENLDELHCANEGLRENMRIMKGKLDELSVIEVEKMELHNMVEGLKRKYDEVEGIRAGQENQIIILSGDYDRQSKEAEWTRETNQKLETELEKLHKEFLETKGREENLNYELQKGRNEVELWESQAGTFFGELQMCAVREALLEGQLHELIEACQSLQDENFAQAVEIGQLKERVTNLEGENGEVKAWMTAYVPAFLSLRDCVTSLENHALSHATPHEVNKKDSKDASMVHAEHCQQTREEECAMVPGGFLDLQELQVRIIAIENALIEKERLVMLENLSANSKLEAAKRYIEELKSRSSLAQEGVKRGKHVNPKSEDKELVAGLSNDSRVRKRTNEIPEEGNRVMTKDIILDQISEGSPYAMIRRETVKADDPMLEIWEITDQDGNIDLAVGKAQKVTTALTQKKHNRDHPSMESLVEKEVGVDKLEISKRFSGSHQEGNERKILERLDSDAQKLTNLQITVQDLKRKVEITEKGQKGKGIEYDSVKEQLDESEEAIMKLFDLNRKIMKSVGDDLVSFDENSALTTGESGSVGRRKIAEQARRGSEKIGRLQLEVQKLQFLLLKLDENKSSKGKTKIMERNRRVLLRDYLYGGTRTSQKRKKGHFCSCVQPPTKGD